MPLEKDETETLSWLYDSYQVYKHNEDSMCLEDLGAVDMQEQNEGCSVRVYETSDGNQQRCDEQ